MLSPVPTKTKAKIKVALAHPAARRLSDNYW